MSCCNNDTPEKPTAAPTPPPVAACPACPDTTIEINDTPATNDDLVLLKCEHPAHRSKTPCRIKATACPGGSNVTVVLVNPDGRLRFPNAGDSTKTLSLPPDGSWVAFEISGETASAALDDAVIEAHCQTAGGAIKGKATVTVVSFDPVTMDATVPAAPAGNYVLGVDSYTVASGNTVDFAAKGTIKPAGVNCAAPQIANLRIGILQNATTPFMIQITWGAPAMTWTGGVKGDTVTPPSQIRTSWTIGGRRNDTDAAAGPLYDRPGVATTLPQSVAGGSAWAIPVGCAGAGTATSWDTPALQSPLVPHTFVQPAKKADGTVVGSLTYNLVNASYDASFITWAVLFDTVTSDVCALREHKWEVHVDSAGAAPQRATSAAADTAPTMDPVTAPPYARDDLGPHSTVAGPVGAATTLFTHP